MCDGKPKTPNRDAVNSSNSMATRNPGMIITSLMKTTILPPRTRQMRLFTKIAAAILPEDWVGPLRATMVLWENGQDQPCRRDGPIVSSSISLLSFNTHGP